VKERRAQIGVGKIVLGISLVCAIVVGLVGLVDAGGSDPTSPAAARRDPNLARENPAADFTRTSSDSISKAEPRRGLGVKGGRPGAGAAPAWDESAPATATDRWSPVFNDEALPCTGPHEPINFETFSVGPSIDSLPLTDGERRCGGGPPATRVNYVSYIYGDCKIPKGGSGCQPPLEVQTWPACQRFLAKYSFRGEPLPHKSLPTPGAAQVVEFNFAFDKRIEVYTGSSTVVIFATDRARAIEAAEMLRPEEIDEPPASNPQELDSSLAGGLEPPAQGSMEGGLPCQV
jgi:hypothetical protein